MKISRFACAAAALLLATPAFAEPVAIVGGKVHTVGRAGTIENGTVVFDNGVITSVGAGLAPPSGAKVIDVKGAHVTPGLMNAYTYLGLIEITQYGDTNDARADKAPFSAAFDVSYGLNPSSVVIPITRLHGVTRAFTAPIAGKTLFAGTGALIALGEGSGFRIRPRAAMFTVVDDRGAELAGGARGASWVFLRKVIADVRFYENNRPAFDRGQARDTLLPPVDLEALIPVVHGDMPLVIQAYRESDIRQVIAFKQEFDLNIILLSATEAWKVADQLAAAQIPVVIDPRDNLPSRFETLAATLENAPRLAKAGVKLIIATGGDTLEQRYGNLTQIAGIAVANGLPWDQALASITRVPAEAWGIADSYGTLERGKDADIVVWSADPLELGSVPTSMFIAGQAQDLSSRQTKLRDRYKDLRNQEPPLGYK